MYKYIFV